MVVRKRRLGGPLVMADRIIQLKVEYIRVAVVLLPMEGGQQGQIME
jgi:hypothetical protein